MAAEFRTMAILSYPTETSISTPLLIDAHQLTALDNLMDQYLGKLREDRDRRIDARTESDMSEENRGSTDEVRLKQMIDRHRKRLYSIYGTEDRSVAIYLRGGKTITSDRFADALALPPVREELAVGFQYDLSVGEIKASVRLRSDSLVIRVVPNESTVAQELYGAIENWASGFAAPFWQDLWRRWASVANLLLILWSTTGLTLLLLPVGPTAKDRYRTEAQQILKQGVSQNNQYRALELMLAIASNYNPQDQTTHFGLRWWGYYIAGILILGVIRTCPRVVIGIGKGKRDLKFWRLWIKLVWVTVPGLIFSSILWPRFLNSLGVH